MFSKALTLLLFFYAPAIAFAQPSSNLTAILQSAEPGETITVGPGDFGDVDLRNMSFSPAVTLQFKDSARLSRLTLRNVRGVTFDGLVLIAGESFNPTADNAAFVFGGGDIVFRNAFFEWSDDANALNDGNGLVIDGADHIAVESSQFRNIRQGLVIRSSSDALVQDVHFRNILSDGVVVSGTNGATIEHSSCVDFMDAEGAGVHADCIQLQAGGRAVANSNVTIRDNVIRKGVGMRAQGVFVHSRYTNEPHVNITIENNYIRQDVGLGVFGGNVSGLIIRGNDVLASHAAEERPRILVRDPADNVLIEGNKAASIRAPASTTLIDNEILD